MIINTFSYLWSKTAVNAIAELVDNGYTTFEVPISAPHCWPADMTPGERASAAARLRELGATVRSLNAGGYDVNLASPGASVRRRSVEHISSVLELAGEWGATDVVISPGTRRPMISPALERVHEWLHDSLEELVPLARQAGVRLLFENTPYCFTPTISELAAVVTTVNDDALKIVYDVANAAYIEEDPVAALTTHHDLIPLVHISDTGTDVWGHDPIGTGVIDWRALGDAVDATLGTDNVVLEIIREQNTLEEFATGTRALSDLGWSLTK